MSRRPETMLLSILFAFGTLLPIANPLSTAFVFNGLARNRSIAERKKIALVASLTAAAVLLVFMVVGHYLLSFFGITIYAFRVAGGIYLAKIAFEMLGSGLVKDQNYADDLEDISVIPLAIPLLAGPGSMTTVLVLSEGALMSTFVSVSIAIVLVSILAWVLLRYAHKINRVFGEVGTKALERVLGLLVLVIAVQFFFNGVSGYMQSIGIGLF